MSNPRILVAAGVLVNQAGQVLVTSRPAGKAFAGLWEFPGGKLEDNETPEAALARELQEELGVRIDISALEPLTFVSHAYEKLHLVMMVYLCRSWQGEVTPAEGQEARFIAPTEFVKYPFLPADLPLLSQIAARLPAPAT